MVKHAEEPTKHSCPNCGFVHEGRVYEPDDEDASKNAGDD